MSKRYTIVLADRQTGSDPPIDDSSAPVCTGLRRRPGVPCARRTGPAAECDEGSESPSLVERDACAGKHQLPRRHRGADRSDRVASVRDQRARHPVPTGSGDRAGDGKASGRREEPRRRRHVCRRSQRDVDAGNQCRVRLVARPDIHDASQRARKASRAI